MVYVHLLITFLVQSEKSISLKKKKERRRSRRRRRRRKKLAQFPIQQRL
jgi:hypothetical protein